MSLTLTDAVVLWNHTGRPHTWAGRNDLPDGLPWACCDVLRVDYTTLTEEMKRAVRHAVRKSAWDGQYGQPPEADEELDQHIAGIVGVSPDYERAPRDYAILPGTSRLCLVIHSIPRIWRFGRWEGALAIEEVYDLAKDAPSAWGCAHQ